MPNVTKWSNVAIAMQSALAAAKDITAITKANPAAVSSATHGLTTGDYVKLTVQGMHQLNARAFKVTVIDAGSYSLDGIDSTAFDTFSDGSGEEITFGTTLGTVTSLTGSGGEFDFLDTTTVHDSIRTQIPGLPSALQYSFENLWDPTDAGLIAMKAASDVQAQRAFLFTFASGTKMLFNGYVGCSMVPVGNAQDLVKTNATITAHGTPSYYAA